MHGNERLACADVILPEATGLGHLAQRRDFRKVIDGRHVLIRKIVDDFDPPGQQLPEQLPQGGNIEHLSGCVVGIVQHDGAALGPARVAPSFPCTASRIAAVSRPNSGVRGTAWTELK